jgi:hypothetical protein
MEDTGSGSVDGENGRHHSQQPGSGDLDDLMDTSVGDEDVGDTPNTEELLKSADSLLGSPSSHKEKVVKKTATRPISVSSLVSDMSLCANKLAEKIPGAPTEKNDDASARIQSDPDLNLKKKNRLWLLPVLKRIRILEPFQ